MSEEENLSYKEAIEKAGSSITRFPLIHIRGVPLMCHIANNWDSIWAFCPDPSDLLIATYPKAGIQRSQLWVYSIFSDEVVLLLYVNPYQGSAIFST